MKGSLSDQELISAGTKVHVASLALNIGLTSEGASIPTEWLCFGFLAASAVGASLLPRFDARLKEERHTLLAERIGAQAFSNATHGFGHIFLFMMGTAAPPLEFSSRPEAVANVLMLIMFWVGVLRLNASLSTAQAAVGAMAVLGAQYLLGVPPELSFTFSQSIIFLAVVLDQLRRRNEYARGDGRLFFLTSIHYLPMYALFCAEMFACSTGPLSRLGGHAVYDLYVSLVPFGLYYAVLGNAKKKVE